MAREADTEAVEDEIRVITDHPEIDGIEDLDGDVEEYGIGIDNLADLDEGDVVRYTGDDDPECWYVVTGRHESSGGGCDETDVIEAELANRHADTLLSRPGSVAYLHGCAAYGELEIRTGLQALRTRLTGKVRETRATLQDRRGVGR